METRDIRLNNLLTLSGKYRKIVEFCRRIDMNPSYFSQIKSGKKAIGDEVARKVERSLGLQRGYLDTPQEGAVTLGTPPNTDMMAVAYSIQSMPESIREQFKRLIFQVASYCTESRGTTADVGSFEVRYKETASDSSKVSKAGRRGR